MMQWKRFMALFLCLFAGFALQAAEECSEENLMTYFPTEIVRNTLSKYQVPQDRWDSIIRDLKQKDPEIIQTVEEKASKMNPNPLQDPNERHKAVQMFRDALQQAFGSVMNVHGVTGPNQINAMLDDIQKQKAELFARCMKDNAPEERGQPPARGQNGPSYGGNPQDDEDYEWDRY